MKALESVPRVAKAQLFTLCLFELSAIVALLTGLGLVVPTYEELAKTNESFNTNPIAEMDKDLKILFFSTIACSALILPLGVALLLKLNLVSELLPERNPNERVEEGWEGKITPEVKSTIFAIKVIAGITWIVCLATTSLSFATYLVTDHISYLLYTIASLIATAAAATLMTKRMSGLTLGYPGKAIAATRDSIVSTQFQLFVQAMVIVSLLGRAMGMGFWPFLFRHVPTSDVVKFFGVLVILLYVLIVTVKLQLTYEQLTAHYSGQELLTAREKERLWGRSVQGQAEAANAVTEQKRQELPRVTDRVEITVPSVSAPLKKSAK
eukprot:g94.t1